jgi:RES domain-containing protein
MFGGRWNQIGSRMVYMSTSLALAAVETFVNIDASQAPDDLIVSEAVMPTSLLVETVDMALLPDPPSLDHTRDAGSSWLAQRKSVALRVPSFAVEGDWNVLLNPEHSDFRMITLRPPRSWHFDARMFRRPTAGR